MSGFTYRPLGKTGLQVSPLGIGGGWGIESRDLLYAFECGINYFFFSSDMHHFAYSRAVAALRQLCGLGSRVRDQVVLATVSYLNDPEKLPAILLDQLGELRVDYIDVFHWGWVTDQSDQAALIQGARSLQQGGSLTREYRRNEALMSRAREINEALLDRGLVRYIGASFHSRRAAVNWMNDLDVMMVRYNPSHRGVERELFPLLQGRKTRDPGIVAFNAAHIDKNRLRETKFSIPDCYRFAISNPYVDVVLAGLRNRVEIDQALQAIARGPLSEEERRALSGITEE